MKAEQFTILRKFARNPEEFDAAVEQIIAGVETGAIRNVVFRDAKNTLSDAVCVAWNKHIEEPHFYSMPYSASDDLRDLFWISMLCLHDVIAANKRANKNKAQGEAADAVRAFCAEALPLAQAVASLKSKVVKGRAPGAGPAKPVNPNKIVKTCPVCLRAIAVQDGTMAHHGYERPDHGRQTASCPGIRFKPLEVSSEGLEWMIAYRRKQLDALKRDIANQDAVPKFLMARRAGTDISEKIDRDSPLWEKAFSRHLAEIRSEIGSIERILPILEAKLAAWKPKVAA